VVHLSSGRGLATARRARLDGAHYWVETWVPVRPTVAGAVRPTRWWSVHVHADYQAAWRRRAALGRNREWGRDVQGVRPQPIRAVSEAWRGDIRSCLSRNPGHRDAAATAVQRRRHQGRMGLDHFVGLTSGSAARILQLPGKGASAPGNDADLVVIDAAERLPCRSGCCTVAVTTRPRKSSQCRVTRSVASVAARW